MRSKGQISLNFGYHVNSKISYQTQTLCASLQIKDRKHIEQNFHSVAGGHVPGVVLGSVTELIFHTPVPTSNTSVDVLG